MNFDNLPRRKPHIADSDLGCCEETYRDAIASCAAGPWIEGAPPDDNNRYLCEAEYWDYDITKERKIVCVLMGPYQEMARWKILRYAKINLEVKR